MVAKAKGVAAKALGIQHHDGEKAPAQSARNKDNDSDRFVFLIAAIARMQIKDAQACLENLRLIVARNLREAGKYKVSYLIGFKVHSRDARPAQIKRSVDGNRLISEKRLSTEGHARYTYTNF